VAVWGAPRATKDIDLLVPPEQIDAIRAVAKERGFLLEAGPITFRDGMELRRLTKYEGSDLLTLDLILVNPTVEAADHSIDDRHIRASGGGQRGLESFGWPAAGVEDRPVTRGHHPPPA